MEAPSLSFSLSLKMGEFPEKRKSSKRICVLKERAGEREKEMTSDPSSAVVNVQFKWGKELYSVDVDTSLPGLALKTQLFSLTECPSRSD